MITYAGIGSRKITFQEKRNIITLAKHLSKLNFVLYSGHADGADQAFEKGADRDKAVIWLPWDGFNGHVFAKHYTVGDDPKGIKSINKFHPAPHRLHKRSKQLMARNHFQIHGNPPEWPQVSFVICCADHDSKGVRGGTGQAVRMAKSLNIPVFNMRTDDWKDELFSMIRTIML